jgi:probable F420-dependent oxidoreductase
VGGAWDRPPYTVEELTKFARSAERLGFRAIWHFDRVLEAPPTYRTAWYEPLITLAALAPETRSVTLGTSVLLLPLRNPVLVAKQAATIDVLSHGRLILGVGAGWSEHEFATLGLSIRQRGGRLEEGVRIIRRLWTEPVVSHQGRYWNFEDIELQPKPLQRPHPPILLGGGAFVPRTEAEQQKLERLLRRAADLGDGWIASTRVPPETIEANIRILRSLLPSDRREGFRLVSQKFTYIVKDESQARQDLARVLYDPLESARQVQLIGTKPELAQRIGRLAQTGINMLTLAPLRLDDELLEFAAAEILPSYSG